MDDPRLADLLRRAGEQGAGPPMGNEGEGGAAALSDEELAKRWSEYMEKLKQNDPNEYELLMKDMAEMQRQKGEGFAPQMPGSGNVLGSNGIRESAHAAEAVDVEPNPGFVIKTRRKDNEKKVFINVCSSEHVQEFSKKKVLQDDGREEEGLNIPLSMGPAYEDKDKAGNPCAVHDMIVNPNVLGDALGDRTGKQRHFLCELAIQCIHQKFQVELDPRYRLPQLRYKGEKVRPQRLRRREKPKIEEVDGASKGGDVATVMGKDKRSAAAKAATAAGLAAGAGSNVGASLAQRRTARETFQSRVSVFELAGGPAAAAAAEEGEEEDGAHALQVEAAMEEEDTTGASAARGQSLSWQPADEMEWRVAFLRASRTAEAPGSAGLAAPDPSFPPYPHAVRVEVFLPRAESMPPHALSLAPWLLTMRAEGFTPVEAFLPAPVLVSRARARFLPSRSVLQITAPTVPEHDAAEVAASRGPDPGSKPWLLQRALRDERSDREPKQAAEAEAWEYPEDRFHITLPDHVEPSTGQPRGGDPQAIPGETLPPDLGPPAEEAGFAEDRFIEKDLMSQHHLAQKRMGEQRSKEKQGEQDAKESERERQMQAEVQRKVQARQRALDEEAEADLAALAAIGGGGSGAVRVPAGVDPRVSAVARAEDRPSRREQAMRQVELEPGMDETAVQEAIENAPAAAAEAPQEATDAPSTNAGAMETAPTSVYDLD